jgi:hypothetical protein
MVKAKPVVKSEVEPEAIARSLTPTKIQHIQTAPVQLTKASQKPAKNRLGILLIGIVAAVTATGYIFWTQNPEYPWSLKLKIWRSQLEQLMP